MAEICNVIKYEGDNKTLIWKHPKEDFNCLTQLIVHESQEAIFFMNGEALDRFGPGRYTLETESLPIVSRVLKRATGDSTPFHSEVYFINMTEQMDIKWGTDTRVEYIDPNYGFPISLGANGRMSFKPEDSKRLLLRMVGTETELSQEKAVEHLRSFLITKVKTYIAQTMKEKSINIFEIDACLDMFSDELYSKILPDFKEYGIALKSFKVTTVVKPDGDVQYERFKNLHFRKKLDIDEATLNQQVQVINAETEARRVVIESQARAKSREQEAYTYAQEKSFEVMKAMAENEGSGSDLRNAGIGLGMGFASAGAFGTAISRMVSDTMGAVTPATGAVVTAPMPAAATAAAATAVMPAEATMAATTAATETATAAATETATAAEEADTIEVSETEGSATEEAVVEDATPVIGAVPVESGEMIEFEKKVNKLFLLKNSGIITEAEFEAKKAELLSMI